MAGKPEDPLSLLPHFYKDNLVRTGLQGTNFPIKIEIGSPEDRFLRPLYYQLQHMIALQYPLVLGMDNKEYSQQFTSIKEAFLNGSLPLPPNYDSMSSNLVPVLTDTRVDLRHKLSKLHVNADAFVYPLATEFQGTDPLKFQEDPHDVPGLKILWIPLKEFAQKAKEYTGLGKHPKLSEVRNKLFQDKKKPLTLTEALDVFRALPDLVEQNGIMICAGSICKGSMFDALRASLISPVLTEYWRRIIYEVMHRDESLETKRESIAKEEKAAHAMTEEYRLLDKMHPQGKFYPRLTYNKRAGKIYLYYDNDHLELGGAMTQVPYTSYIYAISPDTGC